MKNSTYKNTLTPDISANKSQDNLSHSIKDSANFLSVLDYVVEYLIQKDDFNLVSEFPMKIFRLTITSKNHDLTARILSILIQKSQSSNDIEFLLKSLEIEDNLSRFLDVNDYDGFKKLLDILRINIPYNFKENLNDILNSLMFKYCKSNKIESLNFLLDIEGVNPSKKDYYDYTPLHYASLDGNTELVELLLQKGAKVNIKDKFQNTPFHFACQKGHFELVELLLKIGADFNQQNDSKEAPLHLLSINGNAQIAELLLTNKADVNLQNNQQQTPLHLASRYGHIKIAELLLTNKADVNLQNNQQETPLHLASRYGHIKIAELLLTNKADVNLQNNQQETPLHITCRSKKNSHEIPILLASHGADMSIKDKFQKTVIEVACENGDSILLNFFLEKYSNPNSQNNIKSDALIIACKNGYPEIVKLLIDKKVNVNCEDANMTNIPLQNACQYGHTKIVELLIENGADFNKQNHLGKTPLHFACSNFCFEVAEFLIKKMSQNPSNVDKNMIDDLIKDLNATNDKNILNEIYPQRLENKEKILNLLSSFSQGLLKFKQQGNQSSMLVAQVLGQNKPSTNPQGPQVNTRVNNNITCFKII
ncbi:hypothetical protein LBMAG18_11970 [Alphaproteobacteria bacterium]|nr:hypothetical protein LBMAG18_11970 [Alphaproteobacteria bacterium]